MEPNFRGELDRERLKGEKARVAPPVRKTGFPRKKTGDKEVFLWQPTPVPWPGKSHGQRSLVGYSPWGCKELDTTERLHFRRV